jgi:tRNA threonylcarbamoyladenosine biosynthesis protein TsaB
MDAPGRGAEGGSVVVNVLAMDLSTPHLALGVAGSDGEDSALVGPSRRSHGRELIPEIHALLHASGRTIRSINAICVGLGPGSFTGLRIGVTAAKTLAYALKCPVYTLDSPMLLACNMPPQSGQAAVLADAQRGDVFASRFVRREGSGPLERLGPTRLRPLADEVAELEPGTFLVGSAVDRIADADLERFVRATAEQGIPRGEVLLELARRAVESGQGVAIETLEPFYLRRSAAEEKAERADSVEAGAP